ncbi:MAG: helix-turn-helix domain-containing protein, partial [Armatimonadetes bacterium]|nr:helix-turn-helix domain-containing protein [Armatimonadota bacterium]
MKPDPTVRNRLRAARAHAGLSQQEVALAAGVSRQTISGLESGAAAPSAGVALRLARVFGCRLEDLFWLEDALAVVTAAEAGPRPAEIPFRVSLAPSGDGGWIAAPLQGERAFRTELTPCDGLAVPDEAGRGLQVTPLEDPETLQGTLFLAGCTPVLSLWARAAERWRAGLRAHWQFANSSDALHALARGWIHLAAIHLPESDDGPSTPELVRQACGDRPVVLVRLGVWEEGLLVASGNPRSLAGVADLAQDGI